MLAQYSHKGVSLELHGELKARLGNLIKIKRESPSTQIWSIKMTRAESGSGGAHL